jgi:hypothetical protein
MEISLQIPKYFKTVTLEISFEQGRAGFAKLLNQR